MNRSVAVLLACSLAATACRHQQTPLPHDSPAPLAVIGDARLDTTPRDVVVQPPGGEGGRIAGGKLRCADSSTCPAGLRCLSGECRKPESCELTIRFAFDRASLTEESATAIANVADCIREAGWSVTVLEGHADARGGRDYNLALGDRRADAVRRLLVQHGIANVRTVSFGSEIPIVDEENEAAWAQNRRVELRGPGQRLSNDEPVATFTATARRAETGTR